MFGKKKLSLEELLEAAASLSDEEKQKLVEAVQGQPDKGPEEEEQPAGEESAEEPEVPEMPQEAPPEDASAAEQESAPEEPAEEQPEEEPPAEPAQEVPPDTGEGTDRDEALMARIDALEEQVGKLAEMVGSIADENKDFGASPAAETSGDPELTEDDRIMSGYYKNPRAYK